MTSYLSMGLGTMDGSWIYMCVYPMPWRWECIVNLDTQYTNVSRTITREQQTRMHMVNDD